MSFFPPFFLLFFYLHKTKLKNCSNHIYTYVKLSFIQKMFYLQDWKKWFYLHVLSLVGKFEFSVCKIVTIIYWDVILPIDELIFFKMVIAPPTRSEYTAQHDEEMCVKSFTVNEFAIASPSSLWLQGIFTPACSATQSWRWGICVLSLYQTQMCCTQSLANLV